MKLTDTELQKNDTALADALALLRNPALVLSEDDQNPIWTPWH